jgi:hypothetical protein
MAKSTSNKVGLSVGLGLAAAAASAAGFYFYGSKQAHMHRKNVAKWAKDLEAKVMRAAKKVKQLDQKAYAAIIDEASKAYTSVASIDQKDLKKAALELKKNWENVEKEIVRGAKKGEKVAKKAVTTSVKQVTAAAKKVTKAATAKPVARKAAKKKVAK